jgi:hypothetical protein
MLLHVLFHEVAAARLKEDLERDPPEPRTGERESVSLSDTVQPEKICRFRRWRLFKRLP